MRVVYHIQSHTLPDQLSRLIRTIRTSSPDCRVVVSHSETGPDVDLGDRRDDPGITILRVPNGYGDFSHVDRWLEVVDLLVEQGDDFDWICNLTGQDYPVLPLARAERELAEGGMDGYIQHFPVFTGGGRWPRSKGVTRYCFSYVRAGRMSVRVQQALRPLAVLNRVQPLLRFSPAFTAFGVRRRVPVPLADWYGGSFFCSLSRACALHVRDYVADNPDVVRYFRRVLAPDEVFLQTVLVSSGRFRLENDSKRYFDFRNSKRNHPKVLGLEDLPRIEARGAHFARKVDQRVDPALLDRLDELVLGSVHPA